MALVSPCGCIANGIVRTRELLVFDEELLLQVSWSWARDSV